MTAPLGLSSGVVEGESMIGIGEAIECPKKDIRLPSGFYILVSEVIC